MNFLFYHFNFIVAVQSAQDFPASQDQGMHSLSIQLKPTTIVSSTVKANPFILDIF